MVELDFSRNTDGILPAVVQDWTTGEVLMVAYINSEAWERTLRTGKATFWSRSRGESWVKGQTSGNVQYVREIRVDCDCDAVVLKVEQAGGAACHEGYPSCFYRRVTAQGDLEIVQERVFRPEDVYGE